MACVWKDPTSAWTTGEIAERPIDDHRDPLAIGRDTRAFKAPTLPVGRLRYDYRWPGHGGSLWSGLRYAGTRRTTLRIRGEYNPKTLRREKTIVDKRPIWWASGLLLLLIAPLFVPESRQGTLLSASSVFFIYAAVDLCWMLIIGTAGIYSLASFVVVGAAGYGAAWLSITHGIPWWVLPSIGALMLLAVLFLRDGLFGMKAQFRAWRDKKKTEARSSRAEKGGELLPDEAAETADKDSIDVRRFDTMQRDDLKTLISDELIREYEEKPLDQHSAALERVLNYFRRQPQNDKYAVMAVKPFEAYRIVALSGQREVPPRLVEDRVYPTVEDAYRAVFRRRVQDLLES